MRELERAVERVRRDLEREDHNVELIDRILYPLVEIRQADLRTLLSALDGYRKDELLSHMVAQCEEDYAAGWVG